MVAQRFSGLEKSVVGILKFSQENRCSLITSYGASRNLSRCPVLPGEPQYRVLNNVPDTAHRQFATLPLTPRAR